MACTIAIYLYKAINIYIYILIFYALSAWINTDNNIVNKIKYFLRTLAQPMIQSIEDLIPQLRFFSVIIAIFILQFTQSVLIRVCM